MTARDATARFNENALKALPKNCGELTPTTIVASAIDARQIHAGQRRHQPIRRTAARISSETPSAASRKRPGVYRPVLTEHRVAGRIVALRSDHDRALGRLYPAVTWGREVDRGLDSGRLERVHEVVARSAMGAVGARGVGAPELDLLTTMTTGLPRGVVNVDGSRVVAKPEWLVGAHRDIYHDEIATLVLLASGLLALGGARLRARSGR